MSEERDMFGERLQDEPEPERRPERRGRRAAPTTQRLRCRLCLAVLFSDEEELRELCEACIGRAEG